MQDLYFKLEEQGKHIFLNKVLYEYRIHDNGISQEKNKGKAKDWHLYAMKKAFNRRKSLYPGVKNFTSNEFKTYTSQFYLDRF